jgi:hypothetical protein
LKGWVLAIILGFVALLVIVPILVLLFLVPVRSDLSPGSGHDNRVPTDLMALTVHDRLAIQLNWTPVDQGTATYVLQRSEGGGQDSWADVAELEWGASSYLDDQGLEDGVAYLYRIYARDPAGGSGYSNAVSAKATALPQP